MANDDQDNPFSPGPPEEVNRILREINKTIDKYEEQLEDAREKTVKLLIGLHAGGVALIATLSGVFTSGDIANAKPLIVAAIPFVLGLAVSVLVPIARLDWINENKYKEINTGYKSLVSMQLAARDLPDEKIKDLSRIEETIFTRITSSIFLWIFKIARFLLIISFMMLPIGAAFTLWAIWSIARDADMSPLGPQIVPILSSL